MTGNHLSILRRGVGSAAALLFSFTAGLVFLTAQRPPPASGDERFNGRWDIKTAGERPRAWWLEIENAETPAPRGKFISAFGGDLNVIEEISIKNGALRFSWTRQERLSPGAEPVARKLVYTAKLENGKLQGTFEVEGSNQPSVEWTGVRAPVIKETDDGTWREGKPVELFQRREHEWLGVMGRPRTGRLVGERWCVGLHRPWSGHCEPGEVLEF